MPQVDFYILRGTAAAARLKFACGLIEKAYLDGLRVLVRLEDAQEQATLDTLLWTFSDGAFVPHDLQVEGSEALAPVQLTAGALPPRLETFAVLVDLGLAGAVTPQEGAPARIVEIIDADENRRRLGRERFRSYRDRGWTPATHNIDYEN